MRQPTFLVLTALAAGPKHGYAVLQEITASGEVSLRPGTLYAALERLTSEGLVTQTREEVVDGRQRRYYDLTDDGVQALTDQTRRLRENVEQAARSLRLRGVTA
jgi:DNA-binding PadR family transcriptional regulator